MFAVEDAYDPDEILRDPGDLDPDIFVDDEHPKGDNDELLDTDMFRVDEPEDIEDISFDKE